MTVPLKKKRDCEQDDRCDSSRHLIDFFRAVVVCDLLLNETPPNLLHPAVGVTVEMLPCSGFEILEEIIHAVVRLVERRRDFSEL